MKMKGNPLLLLPGYCASKSEGDFPVVSYLCIGEIDGRCMGWWLAVESDALTLGIA